MQRLDAVHAEDENQKEADKQANSDAFDDFLTLFLLTGRSFGLTL